MQITQSTSASTEPYGSSQAAFLKLAGVCAKNASLEKATSGSTWFDAECYQKKKLVRRMISCFKRSGLEEDKILYSAQRKEYKHIMKNKKNDHRKSQIGLLLSVANDPQAFWNQIRRHRRKPTVANSIPKDDWYAHFENFFNSGVENLPSEN